VYGEPYLAVIVMVRSPKCQHCGKCDYPNHGCVNTAGKVVVNTQPVVVNNDEVVVNAPRSKDRHAKTGKRAEYVREYMKSRRTKGKVHE
jgi:uncharacterized Zn-binding protein involved in type VI secretion